MKRINTLKINLLKNWCFLMIVMMINIVGCQSNKTPAKKTNKSTKIQTTESAKSDTIKSSKNAIVEKAVSSSNCDSTIINNEFSYGALAFSVFKANANKIKSLFLDSVVLKMEKKKDEGLPYYYLHNFTDGTNEISLLFNEGFYIEDADIKNDKVRLNKKIAIGMKKDVFLELLKVKNITCDTITVKDDELTFKSVYIFKGNHLREVQMSQTVE